MSTIVIAVIPSILAVISTLFSIVRDVFPVVPVVSHKIHLSVTRIVFIAVFSPMFGVARRDAQIDGLAYHGHALDHHRLRIEKRGPGHVANINLSIKARLADRYRYTDIGRLYGGTKGANYGRRNQDFFHVLVSIIRSYVPNVR
jgi:hypothetical protein